MQNDNEIVTQVAYMYYIDNLPQTEISSILGISRPTVSRLLQTARDKGIVKIEIDSPNIRCFAAEKLLKEKYPIEEAIVVPIHSSKEENILSELGKAGMQFLKRNIKAGMTVAVAMGKTLSEVANHLEEVEKKACNIVPLTGGLGQVSPELHSNDICRRMAEKIGGTAFPFYAPAIVYSEEIKEALTGDPMIQQVLEMARNADMTIAGVGNVSNSTFIDLGIISKEESEEMKKYGVVGDIGSWFFDDKGNILDLELHKRVMGPDFRKVRENSKVVLVAGTEAKQEVIKSVLSGKLADVLITDEKVADFLIHH